MDNMTSLEAYERTLKCLEKGKKGVVQCFALEMERLLWRAQLSTANRSPRHSSG